MPLRRQSLHSKKRRLRLLPQPVPVPPPAPAPAAEEPEPAAPAEQALVDGGVVVATRQPQAARGWERIDGGQWLEAVLVTQIRGDAPGSAIALVSTPFWSRDRQRILIPRGARFIGRAQAVSDQDQSRLTVTFDRLIFDGHDLRLPFAGLSQAGEAGLKDKVNRHYLQTFGAAGAVGVLSGLMLRGTQNYGFGQPAGEAARMETGRALGGASHADPQPLSEPPAHHHHPGRPSHPHLLHFRPARSQETLMTPQNHPIDPVSPVSPDSGPDREVNTRSQARRGVSPVRWTRSTPAGANAARGCSLSLL